MAETVAVPLRLLEDIFRLLEYLDRLEDSDGRHFRIFGYSRRFAHDNALWQLRMKISQFQDQIVETYLLTIGDVSEDELRGLREWVAAGMCVYDNPCLISDESGNPMDFINACRADAEMSDAHPHFSRIGHGDPGDVARDDDLPF